MASPTPASAPGASNSSLHAARRDKNDEFYTQLTDVEKELQHYENHFNGKVVFCNCDDDWSSFWKYFKGKFTVLGLKKLVATHYESGTRSYKLEYFGVGDEVTRTNLLDNCDGDFRSDECRAILDEADIVVTNPPFSLFREYVAQLMEHGKQFLIIGSSNAITYKETFKLISSNQIWLGTTAPKVFKQPDGSIKTFGNICWFTNLEHKKRNEEIVIFRPYAGNEDKYPTYANFNAIEVGKVADIPLDYEGLMGVPITFLDKYNPQQFEIVGSSRTLGRRMSEVAEKGTYSPGGPRFYLNNADGTYRRLYDRIVIKRRQK